MQSTQILRYYDGNFELGHDEAEFGITWIASLRDGTVLLSSLALGPLRYRANRYQVFISSESLAATLNGNQITADNMSSRLSSATGVATHRFAEPNSPVISMAETTDGKVWLGTRDRGLFYISQGRVLPSGKNYRQQSQLLTCPAEWRFMDWDRRRPGAVAESGRGSSAASTRHPYPCHDPGS